MSLNCETLDKVVRKYESCHIFPFKVMLSIGKSGFTTINLEFKTFNVLKTRMPFVTASMEHSKQCNSFFMANKLTFIQKKKY